MEEEVPREGQDGRTNPQATTAEQSWGGPGSSHSPQASRPGCPGLGGQPRPLVTGLVEQVEVRFES